MRKILLFVILITHISFTFAQSLVVTGDTSFSSNSLIQIAHHLEVKNMSGASITVKCIKTNLTLPAGAESFFCFAGNCYAATTDTSTSATLMAGQQISFNNSPPDSDAHSGYYDAFGASGIAEVQYCFYDVNDPADETCMIITYSCFGISYECLNGACTDPGTGNGAFNSLVDCLDSCLIAPTLNCDALGSCADPGDGTGLYSDSTSCQAACVTSLNEKDSHLPEISDFYPNPANGMVNFTFNSNFATLKLLDILGNQVKEIFLLQEGVQKLDLSGLNKGIYFGNLIVRDQIVSIKKLIVK